MKCDCSGRLRRSYYRRRIDGKLKMIEYGWYCADCARQILDRQIKIVED